MSDYEFLNCIEKNANMGMVGIDHILENIKDDNLKSVVERQRKEYENIYNETIRLSNKYNRDLKDIPLMAKVGSYISAKSNLIKDDSKSNISKMMIEGSNKGIIELTEKMNLYDGNNKEILNLAHKLLSTLEYNLNELKKFL